MNIIEKYAHDYRDIKMPEEPLATMLKSFSEDLVAEIVPKKGLSHTEAWESWNECIDQINSNLERLVK